MAAHFTPASDEHKALEQWAEQQEKKEQSKINRYIVEIYAPIVYATICLRLRELCLGCQPNYDTWKDGPVQDIHICGYTSAKIFQQDKNKIIKMALSSDRQEEQYKTFINRILACPDISKRGIFTYMHKEDLQQHLNDLCHDIFIWLKENRPYPIL